MTFFQTEDHASPWSSTPKADVKKNVGPQQKLKSMSLDPMTLEC